LQGEGCAAYARETGDAILIPLGMMTPLADPGVDPEPLEGALPVRFTTELDTA
jgi:hypothetical protein